MIVKTKLWGKNTNGRNASVTVGRPVGPESGLRSNCPGQGTTRSAWHASNTAAKRGTLVTTFSRVGGCSQYSLLPGGE